MFAITTERMSSIIVEESKAQRLSHREGTSPPQAQRRRLRRRSCTIFAHPCSITAKAAPLVACQLQGEFGPSAYSTKHRANKR